MFKNKSVMAVVAIFCMVVACTSFWACSKNEGNAGSGAEVGVSGNTSKKKIKKAKLPTKPSAEEDFVVTLANDSKGVPGAKVTGYVGKGGGVYVPATIQGLPVKWVDMEIPRTAGVTALVVSDGCTSVRINSDKDEYGKRTVLGITNVALPDTIVGFNLRNTQITEFEVPANVESVGPLPTTLKKISFRGVPKEIDEGAFEGTPITTIKLPEGMEKINRGAFSKCTELVSVTLPDSLSTIIEEAFIECTSLESINLPMGLRYIGKAAFKNCSNLKEIVIPESVAASSRGGMVSSIYPSSFEGCLSLPLATQARLKELGSRVKF